MLDLRVAIEGVELARVVLTKGQMTNCVSEVELVGETAQESSQESSVAIMILELAESLRPVKALSVPYMEYVYTVLLLECTN